MVYVGSSKATCGHSRWGVHRVGSRKKITDLDEMENMCVDENKAYAPKETWVNKDKESCKCSMDIKIECS